MVILCIANVYVKEPQYFYPDKIWVKGSCRQAGNLNFKKMATLNPYLNFNGNTEEAKKKRENYSMHFQQEER